MSPPAGDAGSIRRPGPGATSKRLAATWVATVTSMPRLSTPRTPASRLPPHLQAAALVLYRSNSQGLIDRLGRWLPLSRRGGHDARSLFALGVSFLLAGPSFGIRPFTSSLDPAWTSALAAAAGVRSLPSCASVSRALADLEPAQARAAIDRLLADDPATGAALSSPHVLHRDARGEGWHLLDLDPTVTPFQRRELPTGSDLPSPGRLAPGQPGYTGRKRGQLRTRTVPVMHAGAGLWLANRVVSEEGTLVPVVAELAAIVRDGLPAGPGARRAVIRADGEFGSAGAMAAIHRAGLHFLTRFARYKLLESAEARALLASDAWYDVPCSLGGPRRQAAELANVRLPVEGGGTVDARVVMTRLPHAGPPHHGVARGPWQVELFATSLPADAWPAEDLAALYAGRSALENRFAQEDREFGLDRTFSFNPGGQEFMAGIGLYLWNTLVLRGIDLAPLPPAPSPQVARLAPPDPPAPGELGAPVPTGEPPAPPTPTLDEVIAAESPVPPAPSSRRTTPPERELWSITCAIFADVPTEPGWSLDPARKAAVCPAGKLLRLNGVSPSRQSALLLARKHDCLACPLRPSCVKPRPGAAAAHAQAKGIARRVSPAVLDRIKELRRELKRQPQRDLPGEHDVPARGGALPRPTRPRSLPPWVPAAPLFLPAQARQLARRTMQGADIEIVTTSLVPPTPPPHPLLAGDERSRQHRRRTWTERAALRAPVASFEVRAGASSPAGIVPTLLGKPREPTPIRIA